MICPVQTRDHSEISGTAESLVLKLARFCTTRRVLVHLCTGGDVVDEDQSAGIVGHVRRGGYG